MIISCFFYFVGAQIDTQILRKTLDWGGKGGKGGGNEAYQKWLCTTPYFLVIAEKDEKLSRKISRLFLLS